MKIAVIGCGRGGSLITWYLDRIGHQVTLHGRESSARMQRFLSERRNDLLELPASVGLTTDIADVARAETVIISVGSQGLQALMDQLKPLELREKIFVLCMKGLEIGTGRRLSQIAAENLDGSNAVAVWLGPGHVQEFYRGIPNCLPQVKAIYPAFDVTPPELIAGIVTDKGVYDPGQLDRYFDGEVCAFY